MTELNPNKLHVSFQAGASAQELSLPRRHTLTHSDVTGDLFLTIGIDYNRKQVSGFYTRLMRMVIEAFRCGDHELVFAHPEFDQGPCPCGRGGADLP